MVRYINYWNRADIVHPPWEEEVSEVMRNFWDPGVSLELEDNFIAGELMVAAEIAEAGLVAGPALALVGAEMAEEYIAGSTVSSGSSFDLSGYITPDNALRAIQAVYGAENVNVSFPKRKSKMVTAGPADKSRTSTKRKAKQVKGKSVKVSKNLRAKVEKVIEGDKCHGTYVKRQTGLIGRVYVEANLDATDTFLRMQVDGMGNQAWCVRDINVMPWNSCGWFTAAMPFFITRGATSAGIRTVTDQIANVSVNESDSLHFFTPLQVWDIVSKQYGSTKNLIQVPSDTAANFTMKAQVGGGIPTVSSRGLKVFMQNSYVELSFQNQAVRTIKLEIYQCTPKKKVVERNPLTSFIDGLLSDVEAVENNQRITTNRNYTPWQYVNDALRQEDIDPNICPEFKANWSYEKSVVVIAPGESIAYKIQGPQNYEYDFDKFEGLIDSLEPKRWASFKGVGMYLMIKVIGDKQWSINTNAGTNTNVATWEATSGFNNHPGLNAIGTNEAFGWPIVVDAKSYYRYSMPDVIGGIVNGNAGYTVNNQRKDMFHYVSRPDYCLNIVGDNRRLQGPLFNEENPVSGIATVSGMRT